MASEPKDKTIFLIERYNKLTDILEILQKRICETEGDPFLKKIKNKNLCLHYCYILCEPYICCNFNMNAFLFR